MLPAEFKKTLIENIQNVMKQAHYEFSNPKRVSKGEQNLNPFNIVFKPKYIEQIR